MSICSHGDSLSTGAKAVWDLPLAKLSMNDPALIREPYGFYRYMREHHPVYHSSMFGGSWLLFRYCDAKAVLVDRRLSSERAEVPLRGLPPEQRLTYTAMIDLFKQWLPFHRPPEHTAFRRYMNQVCEPISDETLTPRVERIVGVLLDPLLPGSHVDLMRDIAEPLPSMVVCEVLGLPSTKHALISGWCDDISHIYNSSHITAQDLDAAHASTQEFMGLLKEGLDRGYDPDTVLGRAQHFDADGFRLDEQQLLSQGIMLAFAGLEGARYNIGNAFLALHEHPDQMRLLKADHRLIPTAVEELLRYDSPVQFVSRVAAESFHYRRGDLMADVAEGEVVIAVIGSANRDEDVFDDPAALDLRRAPNKHLAFGHGGYYCMGGPMVRTETRILLSRMLKRFPDLRVIPTSDLEWNKNLGFHGFRSLPMTL
jgi:cytochrome P450